MSPLDTSIQRKQELLSRLYGQGIPNAPLPSLKWTRNAYRPETKALARKSIARQLLISASNDKVMKSINVGESLDLSLIKSKGTLKEERDQSPYKRDSRFSMGMHSITGVSVMSPLKPNSRATLTRSNIYSVKENYLRSRKLRDYSLVNASRAPRELELSSQEHLERIWSNKLIEKMIYNKAELNLIDVNQNTDINELEENKLQEEEKTIIKGLDKHLEEMIKDTEQGNIRFMYFNIKEGISNPYDLELTTYNDRNVFSFFTISKKGVTQYRNDKAVDFISLPEWLVERELYKQTTAIPFFHNFKRWKLLKVWRKGILSVKRKHVIEDLSDKLFFADDAYRDYLLTYRKSMCEMEKLRFIDLNRQGDDITVDDFSRKQKKKQKATADKIMEFSKNNREEFRKLIEKALNRLKRKVNADADDNPLSGNEEAKHNSVLESLGFPSSLAYGHRAALRRECIRFLRLAYLNDFLAIKSLGDIYLSTVNEVHKMLITLDVNAKVETAETQDILYKNVGADPLLQIRVNFIPKEIPEEYIIKKEIKEFNEGFSKPKEFDITSHVEIEPEVKNGNEAKYIKKYFTREVPNIVDLWVELEPGESKLEGILKDWIDNGLKVIGNFERWSKHEELVKYAQALEEWDEIIGDVWEQPLAINLDALCYINESNLYKKKDENLHKIIVSAYSKASDFLQVFKKYLRYYWINDQTDFSILFHERVLKPVDTLASALKLLDYQKKKFAVKIPQGCNLGILKIDCTRIRKSLLPSPTTAMKKIETIGNEIVKKNLQEVKKWLTDSHRQLTKDVITVEDYVNQKNAWNKISESFQSIRDKTDICGSMYNIFPEFSLLVKKDDRVYHTECLQEIKQMNTVIENVSDQQELHLESIKKKLNEKLIPELTVQLENLVKEVNDEKLLTKEDELDKVLERINALETVYSNCEGLAEKYRNYQQTLNMEVTDFLLVEEIREGLELRSTLWKSLKEWSSLTSRWASQQFSTINFQEIGPKADQYAAIASRVDKELPENPISKELKVAVSTFSKAVPIVQDLTSKTLKKTHWDMIKNLLGVDFDITDPEFTLKSLLDLRAVEYQEEIHQIAVQASQEDALRKQLTLLDEQWKIVTFTIKQYKYKDTYVLDEADVLLNIMDESLANVNTILGSRYIKALLSEAEGWRNSLLNLQTLLDEWISYQKRWIYLENIFSGQDIKKQLANEAAKFDNVDKYFKKFMQKANKTPQPFKLIKQFRTNLIETFRNHNKVLDEIEKQLEDYLETKRKAFPRFYFLSNDELLEILANQQQLDVIQQALRKCFDNLVKLDISEGLDIIAMYSSEGERVPFSKQSKAKDNVEIWLDVLQANMRDTLARAMKVGLQDYDVTDRKDWVLKHYGQVVATVAQIMWCMITESSIADMPTSGSALLEWYEENVAQIQQLTELVRGKLDSVSRKIIVALVTTDVHARDIVETLAVANVSQLNDFNWQKQLRYYWDEEEYIQKNHGCYVRQVAARLEYGYEYIGPSSRLVITPLTDRCWITITGALHINLGAAPAGPAGTGKTESTKDLAKGLGIYCIVFNCSEQINYKMMARLFSGVVQQGAWTCLDEFNRINIEVLSVIARQMMDIRMALVRRVEVFNFEDKEIVLRGRCGIFITMNPGYAGRTELPDNLKVHFRPVSMMIPDYQLIAEIMLFAEGFSHAKVLSKKMVKLYKLASEQLSQQDHYDFGMRAVKSVLVMAGSLKRAEPNLSEDAVLLRAMRDSNIPKFVKDDLPLFHALIKDLFPTLEVQPVSYGALQTQIEDSVIKLNLQKVPGFILKVLQLYEVFTIRFGVMIVGLTGGGKTTCFEVLRDAIEELHKKYPEDERYYNINLDILNPKAIGLGELYGEVNNSTQEWKDGLASKLIRRAAEGITSDKFWIVFDGPVDSLWIENMNTVLDDTMTLCLSNGQRIKLHFGMKMLFEVQDLAVASPATVSRCGMVYLAGDTVGWRPYVQTWLQTTFKTDEVLPAESKDMLLGLFDSSVEKGLTKIRSGLREPIKTGDLQLVHSLCNFLEVLLTEKYVKGDDSAKKKIVQSVFVFSFVWGLAASVDETSKDKVRVGVKL